VGSAQQVPTPRVREGGEGSSFELQMFLPTSPKMAFPGQTKALVYRRMADKGKVSELNEIGVYLGVSPLKVGPSIKTTTHLHIRDNSLRVEG